MRALLGLPIQPPNGKISPMQDVALRAHKDKLLTPLVMRLGRRVHPNTVSALALGVGLLAAAAVTQHAYGLGLALWALNRILDGLDGLIARLFNKQSDFGGYLDLMLDFVVYLAIPLAFVYADPTPFNLWAGLALISVYVLNTLSWTVLSAILEKQRRHNEDRLTTVEMPAGLIEGAETILFYSLFFIHPTGVGWLFALMALLVLLTAGQRVVWAYRHLTR
jgi:phosphatidylglycerophosphate synthase